jgi:hypothetical protein
MEKANAGIGSSRITKQGVRDLNDYGPKRGKGAPAASPEANGAESSDDPDGGDDRDRVRRRRHVDA